MGLVEIQPRLKSSPFGTRHKRIIESTCVCTVGEKLDTLYRTNLEEKTNTAGAHLGVIWVICLGTPRFSIDTQRPNSRTPLGHMLRVGLECSSDPFWDP